MNELKGIQQAGACLEYEIYIYLVRLIYIVLEVAFVLGHNIITCEIIFLTLLLVPIFVKYKNAIVDELRDREVGVRFDLPLLLNSLLKLLNAFNFCGQNLMVL